MRREMREHVPSVLVATLSAAFGVSLLEITAVLGQIIAADDVTGRSKTVGILLGIVAFVFIVISIYVGAIVTANTFATIIAGRTRTIALLRLIGSSAASQRRGVAHEGLTVGILGAVLGVVSGTAVTVVVVTIATATRFVPSLPYTFVEPVVLLPAVAVVLTTWLASWVGSRRVLLVSPIQATGGAVEKSRDEVSGRRGRNVTAVVLFSVGAGLLGLGVLVGLVNPGGVLIGLVGGILSFTGLVLGAHLVMPPALRLTGRMFGSSATARLAAENAVRYPERSSRTTIGLVIGVTLITMFAVAVASYQQMILAAQRSQPEAYQGVDQTLAITVGVFSVLMGFSALIAAIGMVNNLSLSVLQRTRELGLLRALGFTARQVRRMILAESAQLTVAAVLVGLVLGVFYGWAGAQSLLGSIHGSPGLIVPAVPLLLIGIVVAGAAVLTLVASIAPSRRATRVAPVAALAVD
ncbi:ABC transporter permease [Lacisediminihabitans profunda]|uniref:FtsX-like permease family protein n=1 Tax=Lacisediminihabitans profunda TaxID=2594790 RepID=A0A5C8UYV5_9MICO|nr:FtsX-like permease family protein [Lacisediminihabitans profunda]TXN32859.1 FtsX-like permease family protein [Lacisediminihabitans profunda]